MSDITFTVYVTASATEEQIVQELSIEPAEWAALDEEVRWAVLQTKEAAEAALRIAYRKEDRPGDGFSGLAGRVMNIADDHENDAPRPLSLAVLEQVHSRLYWDRRALLIGKASDFLHPPVHTGSLRPWRPAALPDAPVEVRPVARLSPGRAVADETVTALGGRILR